VYTKAQLYKLSIYIYNSFPKTNLGTKRVIYSRTLNNTLLIIIIVLTYFNKAFIYYNLAN
jgi:hypothetical protein